MQGTFSYLPDLTDEEIGRQIAYGLAHGWSVAIEHTDDPHPRTTYWHLWGMPMFDLEDPSPALHEIRRCREAHPEHHIRVSLHDPSQTRMSTALQFIVHRPSSRPR
jgi:ribulose-bisphosphate carboxylase small chain